MAGKTSPGFKITGLDKIADPNPVPENAPKLTSPLLSEADVIKAAMSGKAQIIGGSDPGFVDAATRPKSSGGSSILGGVDNFVSNVGGQVTETVKPVATPVVEKVVAPAVQAVEEVAKPVEQVAQTVVKAAEPVVQAAVETAQVPFKAVEDITKIDVPKVVESVAQEVVQAPPKVTETVVKAAEPVVQSAVEVVQQPVKLVEEISKIDVPKVVENVVTQAATTVTETPKMVVKVAEEAVLKPASAATVYATNELKQAGELVFNNLIDPFQPGETKGTVAEEPVAADLDAKDFEGNEDPFGNIETATTKADKLTEEERLRRIRRLMLNRYGREDTILTGAKDPFNRRRYASAL